MPNHVHTVLTLKKGSQPLYKILQRHKGFTAGKANKVLGRTGDFWDHETYDHLIRSDTELVKIVNYVLNNPVKAGFVNHSCEWKWNYINPQLLEKFPNQIAKSCYI